MKFWNQSSGETTVTELTLWSTVVSLIAITIMWIATTTDFFEKVAGKIAGIWNKIVHK